MNVVAKFRCTQKVERYIGGNPDTACDVELVPTFDDDGPNKQWSQYTPAGKIEMTITNPPAAAAFVIGAEYMITFDKAD